MPQIISLYLKVQFSTLWPPDYIIYLQVTVRVIANQGITVSQEVAVVTLGNFIGNLGGILNLWVGLSFITIIELVEMFINISEKVRNYFRRT